MEDDKKKKKRNKKKKNKQGEATDDVSVSGNGQVSQAAGDVHSDDASSVGNGQVSEACAGARSDAVRDGDGYVNGKRHESNGTESRLLAESEKKWLQREDTLEETIKQLQIEKDVYIQKEATLGVTIKQLQNENDSRIQKEATLHDTIKKMREETDSHIQKEAGLQMENEHLQSEKVLWLQKEVGLEDKIGRLVDEKGTLHSEKTSLQEKVKHLEGDRETWTLKEDSFKGTLATQNDDIAGLRAQVSELEQSRNNLVQENQQLMENISSLQLQIKNLENVYSTPASDELAKQASEHEELNSQVEAACSLVEKLVAENAELVEKVNELYGELDRRSLTVELTSTTESNTPVVPPEAASAIDPVSVSTEDMSTSDEKLDSPKVVPIKQEMHSNGNVDSEHAALVPELPVSDEVSEIVQIPLEENEVRNLEVSLENDKNAGVPLAEAPLIGAPFRLMSYVARYVSGADLVNKGST
ncbi:E3 ubiquitin-protein ligase BRE1-like [Pyrus ussuriensis x Pyrus communis]|uniref:E3 ubiquitin-protein ligase BRE1-like n=1 Tax=Pyrus ussuriensis x Pyrus communis TaxID=2448454 RepID=A0A5N5HY69_9ROSA|nr:E3 ubiquitin-protein ligase BRE1-like [Pyrus ussuriensis x Pyrus communis]